MRPCRLIVDPPAPGAWNMAVDEALLMAAAEEGAGTLRFYQWCEPTLSLGYFQQIADRKLHPASRHCAVVRRQTGGGAILHDRELTYSLVLPAGDPVARNTQQLYCQVHQAIIDVLELHLDPVAGALRTCDVTPSKSSEPEPFLCFQRRASGDVLIVARHGDESVKIVGSAQRRWRGAVLQHGSILLERSTAAPELAGLRDHAGKAILVDALISGLSNRYGQAMDVTFTNQPLPQDFAEAVRRIAAAKYNAPAWTNRR